MAAVDRFDEQLCFFNEPTGLLLTWIRSRAMTDEEILCELASRVAIAPDVRIEESLTKFCVDQLGVIGRFGPLGAPSPAG